MLTLASDFGSPYPAAMKGVILRRTDARLVDVAHDFPRQDVRAAAFWCRETLPYFPPAVHLVVVDPGVGTDRDAIVVRVGDHALVGPDNGVLLPPARRLAERADREQETESRIAEQGDGERGTEANQSDQTPEIECFRYDYEDPASSTFHGRDVFAPAAAAVHEAGTDAIESLEPVTPIESFAPDADPEHVVDCRFPTAEIDDRGTAAAEARGEVLVVDDFGNAITNVPGSFLDGREGETVAVNGVSAPIATAFADVPKGERLVTVGSHGFVEFDVNQGRGDDAFGLEPGDDVDITTS